MVVLIRKCSKSNVTDRLESEDPQSYNTMGWIHGAATPWGRFTELQYIWGGFTCYNTNGVDSRSTTPMGWIHGATTPWSGFMELQYHGVDPWCYNITGWHTNESF